MPSLEIYYTKSTSYSEFVNELTSVITKNDFMVTSSGDVPDNLRDVKGNTIGLSGSSYACKYFSFADFCDTPSTQHCLIITAAVYPNIHLNCVPVCSSVAFYSDESKTFTKVNYSGDSSIYNNFRAIRYADSKTKYLSLGRPDESMTMSTHVFTSIDDSTRTKTVLIVTDKDGYVSLYDSYNPYPWNVENTYHNGNNIGYTSSINAYKLAIKGYYCDNLYYFDGAYSMPGEGVSTIGGIKFLKLGNSNLFIKME